MGAFNGFADEGFIAGRVDPEHGDIWATPTSLISHGVCAIPHEFLDDALALGWEDAGRFDDRYQRIRRRPEDRPK